MVVTIPQNVVVLPRFVARSFVIILQKLDGITKPPDMEIGIPDDFRQFRFVRLFHIIDDGNDIVDHFTVFLLLVVNLTHIHGNHLREIGITL